MSAVIAQKIERQETHSFSPVAIQIPQGFLFKAGRLVLSTAFVTMLVAALHPEVRSQIRGAVLKDYRTIVSTAAGDLHGTGEALKVVKVKTRDALYLEVYASEIDGTQKLLEKIEMPDSKDGFFSFNGQATNLAVDDIDGDGRPEILAPSFDQNLVGHLNVYRYDESSQAFRRILR